MRRMGVSVGGLLLAEFLIRRFLRRSRYRHSRRAFFNDVEDPRNRDRVAGLHFLERDFQRHALDLISAVLELSGKILSQCLGIAPEITGDPVLRPTSSPKKAHKLLIFLVLSK